MKVVSSLRNAQLKETITKNAKLKCKMMLVNVNVLKMQIVLSSEFKTTNRGTCPMRSSGCAQEEQALG